MQNKAQFVRALENAIVVMVKQYSELVVAMMPVVKKVRDLDRSISIAQRLIDTARDIPEEEFNEMVKTIPDEYKELVSEMAAKNIAVN